MNSTKYTFYAPKAYIQTVKSLGLKGIRPNPHWGDDTVTIDLVGTDKGTEENPMGDFSRFQFNSKEQYGERFSVDFYISEAEIILSCDQFVGMNQSQLMEFIAPKLDKIKNKLRGTYDSESTYTTTKQDTPTFYFGDMSTSIEVEGCTIQSRYIKAHLSDPTLVNKLYKYLDGKTNQKTNEEIKMNEAKHLNEGPGAGYSFEGKLYIGDVNKFDIVSMESPTSLFGGDTNSFTERIVTINCDAEGRIHDLSFHSYYYGSEVPATYARVSQIKLSVYVDNRVLEEEHTSVEEYIKSHIDIIKNNIGDAVIDLDYTYGGGWTHSTFDGTVASINELVNSDTVYENDFDWTVIAVEAKVSDENLIGYIDKAVTGDTFVDTYNVYDEYDELIADFSDEDEAIDYAKANRGVYVRKITFEEMPNGDWEATDFDDEVVWERDFEKGYKYDDEDIEESLSETTAPQKSPTSTLVHQENPNLIPNYKTGTYEEKPQNPLVLTCSMNEDVSGDERGESLANYLGLNPEDIEVSSYNDKLYETVDGEEYLVLTPEEAEEEARADIENIFDDLGLESFTEYFQEWIKDNALDSEWFEDAQQESNESYVEDIESESDDTYDNRLVAELYDEGLISDDDLEVTEDGTYTLRDYDTVIDELKEEYVERLCEREPDAVQWFIDNFGSQEINRVIESNPWVIDMDAVVDECIYQDGVAHFIARYDGEEIDLENGYYAYRQN